MSTQLTPHFTLEELTFSSTAVRHGVSNIPKDKTLLDNIRKSAEFLEAVREKLGKPIRVLSCYRSPEVNKLVGGAKHSAHLEGKAIDIQVPGMGNKDLALFVKKHAPDASQIILEFDSWVHVEIPGRDRGVNTYLTAVKKNGKTVYLTDFA